VHVYEDLSVHVCVSLCVCEGFLSSDGVALCVSVYVPVSVFLSVLVSVLVCLSVCWGFV
jgi:hypothetical protein